jgi:hypothetical protein
LNHRIQRQIAELQIAELQSAELQIAELQIAELQGAELQGAELQIAELQSGRSKQWCDEGRVSMLCSGCFATFGDLACFAHILKSD